MRAEAKFSKGQPGWEVRVSHDGPYVMLAQWFPTESDAIFWRDRFNSALAEHDRAVADLYRPSLSMCQGAYDGQIEATRHTL